MQKQSKIAQGETRLGTMASPLLCLLGQSMLCVNAAVAEGSRRGTAVVLRMRGEMQFKEERQAKSVSYRWKQPKVEDRVNMKKEPTLLRCTLVNGSAWSTERKYRRRYKGKCDIFLGLSTD